MLIKLTEVIELEVGHDELNSLQELTELGDEVVLVDGVVDEVLASPIPEPVDVQVVVKQEFAIKYSVHVARVSHCLHGHGADMHRADYHGEDGQAHPYLPVNFGLDVLPRL